VISPLLALAVAVLVARRPRVRYALTMAVVIGPLLVLLPLAVMHGGRGAVLAAAAAAVEVAAVVFAALALAAARRAAPGRRVAHLGDAATAAAVAGGMVGSVALVTSFVFSSAG
jgi:hypothetical protein